MGKVAGRDQPRQHYIQTKETNRASTPLSKGAGGMKKKQQL